MSDDEITLYYNCTFPLLRGSSGTLRTWCIQGDVTCNVSSEKIDFGTNESFRIRNISRFSMHRTRQSTFEGYHKAAQSLPLVICCSGTLDDQIFSTLFMLIADYTHFKCLLLSMSNVGNSLLH